MLKTNVHLTEVETRTSTMRMWRVEVEGVIVGFIEKYTDTRTEQNPYKAFLGVGANNQYLDAVYPVSHRASHLAAAREAAVELILANR